MLFKLSSAVCSNFDQSKILSSDNGLTPPPKKKKKNYRQLYQNIKTFKLFPIDTITLADDEVCL